MKTKLFFLMTLFSLSLFYSQFTTGIVSLPTAGMTVKIDTDPTTVTLTLSGDSSSMLSVAFNAIVMADLPDGFVYNTTANRDYTLNDHAAPSLDGSQDWTQISNTVSGSTRTVVATRSLTGGSGDYVFTNSAGNLNIIYARRAGNTNIGYHGNLRGATTVSFSTLGVDDISNIKESFKIIQNPVKDNLEFEISTSYKSAKIYDITGKNVKSFNNTEKTLNVGELKSGVYFLEIETKENGSFFEKFIKQ